MGSQNFIQYGDADDQKITFTTKNASIVGSNGSGKSTLMRCIKQHNNGFMIISAHKNLTIKQGAYRAQDDNWLLLNESHYHSPTSGDTNVPSDNNSVQDDFNQIIEIVFRSYSDESVEAINSGRTLNDIDRKLDQIIRVWNSIFIDKKLLYKEKQIMVQVVGEEIFYTIENLSDGERSALYILIKIVLVDSSPTIIIDEPETFLNSSILNSLFDECEKIKNESTFLYLSHDLEFVTARKDNTVFWIKEYKYPNDWVVVDVNPEDLPEELIIKIVGAKKQKILFVESKKNKDSQLYQLLYPEFKICSVGSYENVINYTKAFNTKSEKYNKEYFGLIDRDLRSDEEIESLKNDKVFVLPVAIYENIYLLKGVIEYTFTHLGRTDFNDALNKIELNVKQKLEDDHYKLCYKKSKIQRLFNTSIESVAKGESQFTPNLDAYDSEITSFKSRKYDDVLKVFNQKTLKGCVQMLGFTWSKWQIQVLNIFNTDKADDIRNEFLKTMPDIK